MINIEELQFKTTESLKLLSLARTILFRSYAYSTSREDSDIYSYVVTNDDFIPQTWRDESDIKLKVSRSIKDIIQLVIESEVQQSTTLKTHKELGHD